MKNHYSAKQIFEMKISGLPTSRRGLDKYISANNWGYVEVPSRGVGGMRREYFLPSEIAQKVKAQVLNDVIAAADVDLPALPVVLTEPENLNHLKAWQKEKALARLALVREVHRQMQPDCGGKGKTAAIMYVIDQAAAGTLPAELQALVTVANARAGQERMVSRRSLFDWVGAVEQAELAKRSAMGALAPKAKAMKIPEWAGPLLKLWGQPQKPSLAAVLEVLPSHLDKGCEVPSYGQAYRFLMNEMGAVEREKGRSGPRQLKNIRPFNRRDTSELFASAVYSADGHCFDAEIAHPLTGRAFKPEITSIVDVYSRLIVGWSVNLAESTWAVLDAIRMAACDWSVPAVFYVDNGSGYENAVLGAEGLGLLNALGITKTNSLPYNSQAKGVIERLHLSVWVKAAKTLPTYMGKDMDAEAKQKAFKLTRADIKKIGQSKLLMQWPEFAQFCADTVAAYNNKPHSALPKIRDAQTLKYRYMTPLEMWQKSVESGAQITRVEESESDYLFRPMITRRVLRGEIKLFGNTYFSRDLEQYHDTEVTVCYEIQNAEKIWVHDEEGRLIAKAVWNGNKSAYFPKSFVERAVEKRAAGQLRRLSLKEQDVLEQLSPRQVIEHQAKKTAPLPDAKREKLAAELNALNPEDNKVIHFPSRKMPQIIDVEAVEVVQESTEARWVRLANKVLSKEELNEQEQQQFSFFMKTAKFKILLETNAAVREAAAALGLTG